MDDKKLDKPVVPTGDKEQFVSVLPGSHREKMLQFITAEPSESHVPVVAERYGRDWSTAPQSLREGLPFVPKGRVSEPDLGADAIEGIPEP